MTPRDDDTQGPGSIDCKFIVERSAKSQGFGLQLLPGDNSVPYTRQGSRDRNPAGFVGHHFGVTRSKGNQMSAAGPCPKQSRGGAGFSQWISDSEGVETEDIDTWYTTGVDRIPSCGALPGEAGRASGLSVAHGRGKRNPAIDLG